MPTVNVGCELLLPDMNIRADTHFAKQPTLPLDVIERFGRQLILPSWSLKTQRKIFESSLLIDGSLTTGILYAAAAGVQRIYTIAKLEPMLKAHCLGFYSALELQSADEYLSEGVWQLDAPNFAILNSQKAWDSSNYGLCSEDTEIYQLAEKEVKHNNLSILSLGDFADSKNLSSWYDFASCAIIAQYLSELNRSINP